MGDVVGRIGVLNPSTGEINTVELTLRQRGKKRTITSMYGATWLATPGHAHARLADMKSLTSLRVLHYLLSEMDVGNDIKVHVSHIAIALDMPRQQASRAIGDLKRRGIILDRVPFGFRLHPDYGWRGDPTGKVIKGARGLELV